MNFWTLSITILLIVGLHLLLNYLDINGVPLTDKDEGNYPLGGHPYLDLLAKHLNGTLEEYEDIENHGIEMKIKKKNHKRERGHVARKFYKKINQDHMRKELLDFAESSDIYYEDPYLRFTTGRNPNTGVSTMGYDPIKPGNHFTSNLNQANFKSNVLNLPSFFNYRDPTYGANKSPIDHGNMQSYDNLLLIDDPQLRSTVTRNPPPTSNSGSGEQWVYKDESMMNMSSNHAPGGMIAGYDNTFGSGYGDSSNDFQNVGNWNRKPLLMDCRKEAPSNKPYQLQDLRPGSSILGDLGNSPSRTVY